MKVGTHLNGGLAPVIEVNILVSRRYCALKSPRIFKKYLCLAPTLRLSDLIGVGCNLLSLIF